MSVVEFWTERQVVVGESEAMKLAQALGGVLEMCRWTQGTGKVVGWNIREEEVTGDKSATVLGITTEGDVLTRVKSLRSDLVPVFTDEARSRLKASANLVVGSRGWHDWLGLVAEVRIDPMVEAPNWPVRGVSEIVFEQIQ